VAADLVGRNTKDVGVGVGVGGGEGAEGVLEEGYIEFCCKGGGYGSDAWTGDCALLV